MNLSELCQGLFGSRRDLHQRDHLLSFYMNRRFFSPFEEASTFDSFGFSFTDNHDFFVAVCFFDQTTRDTDRCADVRAKK